MKDKTCEVLMGGAGPVGLVGGIDLAQRGVDVNVAAEILHLFDIFRLCREALDLERRFKGRVYPWPVQFHHIHTGL